MTPAQSQEKKVHIIQGEFFVTADRDVMVTTILGSCVAACIRDPLAGVGGINHYLLPGNIDRARNAEAERVGVHLMEMLVNGLLKAGARRDRLEAKLFGGARTVRSQSDIGKNNADFALGFLKAESISYVGGSTGGPRGRRIQYWPVSGRARQILLTGTTEMEQPIKLPAASVVENAGELELF
jgi:chemotaxis protein CheD